MNSATPTPPPRSLAEGNRFQRAYHRWALPHYQRLAPDLREQVEAIDRHLYSRQGLWTWLGALSAWAGAALGLARLGLPGGLAALLSGVVLAGLAVMLIQAWLQPEPLLRKLRSPWRLAGFVAMGFAGVFLGLGVGQGLRLGTLDAQAYLDLVERKLHSFAPGVLLGMTGVLLLRWTLARVRANVLQRQRDRARLEAERDAATAEARQAELRLLQAQIHPHFIFNTLAALQHWVDKGDPRAGPLLREVTAFLRGATELLGQPSVSLADEWAQVGHYLAIMKARWGERLRYEREAAGDWAGCRLPPGLLLTLVENAIEHGIAHQLQGGSVRVSATASDGQWTLQVRDDGAGLSPGWAPGVGLTNLRRRLQHQLGPNATLTLESHPDGGCLATLRIPQ